MNILVTGGMGFIGSNFIEFLLKKEEVKKVINIDCPSDAAAAANRDNCKEFIPNEKYFFYDVWLQTILHPITNKRVCEIIDTHQIDHIVHFAAESHVDNSIKNPTRFIESNIVGTFNLLEVLRKKYPNIRFHHISTDEVYGSLGDDGAFTEETPYDPSSPYSATKASSDMLVRSYFRTFKLPVTISNCSNNYGPKQHKEKFIPTVIDSILNNKKIPVYGTGKNIRDWIYVEDHCDAVWKILLNGKLGETYNVGGNCEKRNLEIVEIICNSLNVKSKDYIEYVSDRKGHDYRYAIDNQKIKMELGWNPKTSFEEGIIKTINYYK